MGKQKSAASGSENLLAAIKEYRQMHINIIDRSLKTTIVVAALNGKISPQTAYEVINGLGYRGI